jgi:hypothetical protein
MILPMALTRTRRRILIATLVVVGLIASLFKWLEPQRDSRFVGAWVVNTSGPKVKTYWRFDADGSGQNWYEKYSEGLMELVEAPTRWSWASNGTSIFVFEEGPRKHLPAAIVRWCRMLGIRIPGRDLYHFEVSEIGEDKMVLKDLRFGGSERKLVRVSE